MNRSKERDMTANMKRPSCFTDRVPGWYTLHVQGRSDGDVAERAQFDLFRQCCLFPSQWKRQHFV